MALETTALAKKAASLPVWTAGLPLKPAALHQIGACMARPGARLPRNAAAPALEGATLPVLPEGCGEKSGIVAPLTRNVAPRTRNAGPSSGNAAPKWGNTAGRRCNCAGERRTPKVVIPANAGTQLRTLPDRPEPSHAAATGSFPGPDPVRERCFRCVRRIPRTASAPDTVIPANAGTQLRTLPDRPEPSHAAVTGRQTKPSQPGLPPHIPDWIARMPCARLPSGRSSPCCDSPEALRTGCHAAIIECVSHPLRFSIECRAGSGRVCASATGQGD